MPSKPLTADKSWIESPVEGDHRILEAYHRVITTEEWVGDVWHKHYHAAVVADGGILVTRQRDSIRGDPIGPHGTYRPTLVPSEIWYLPRCSFEESLQCLKFFGFPSAEKTRNPPISMTKFREFLFQLAAGRHLTMVRASSSTAQYQLVSGPPFTRAEILAVLKFNDVEFGAQREKWEHREYVKLFLKDQFVILGRF
jgi:hypothetical protein